MTAINTLLKLAIWRGSNKKPKHAKKQTAKVIIFDFDGTLADGAGLMKEIYNELAQTKGWRQVRTEDIPELRKKSITQAMKWANVKAWQIPSALRIGLREFEQNSSDIKLFDGIVELLRSLHGSGYRLFILSSNKNSTVKAILKRNGVDDIVDILHSAPLFGKHSAIKKFLKKNEFSKKDVWMVGDEVRDIKAAKTTGLKIIVVGWGLQDKSILLQNKPFALANKPKDIAKIIYKNNLGKRDRFKVLFKRYGGQKS